MRFPPKSVLGLMTTVRTGSVIECLVSLSIYAYLWSGFSFAACCELLSMLCLGESWMEAEVLLSRFLSVSN